MNEHPFTRTPVVIVGIIAAAALLGGIIVIVGLSPDAGPRVASILTITLPTSLIALTGVLVSLRNGRTVAATKESVDAVQAQTNGTTTALLAHALGTRTLNTAELKVIATNVDNNAQKGGQ